MIGGVTTVEGSKDPFFTFFGSSRVLNTNDVYDPVTNKWENRRPMAVPRNHAFAGAVNGKIYVIGGRIGAGNIPATTNIDVVEEYNPATNQWGPIKDRMPTARSGGGAATYNGKIYVGGGELHDRYSSLCRTSAPLRRGIQRFTGITQAMVDDAPSLEQVLPPLAEMMRGRVMVAHNAPFDRRVLRQALERPVGVA